MLGIGFTFGKPDGDFIPSESCHDWNMVELIIGNERVWVSGKEGSTVLPVDHSSIGQAQTVLQACMLRGKRIEEEELNLSTERIGIQYSISSFK